MCDDHLTTVENETKPSTQSEFYCERVKLGQFSRFPV